ncbi:hypothetical protein AVU32_gp078 [Vibrio phage ValKK3]|uniref:Uncharacterized protein n=1 Tax=Vibrio phage ValKK3 TaxID=1610855 RepID=A0A0D4DAB2_9CAUD|nr:hypothetical protein AVU32_gp078 [Vibrio phage ValKK3]AJT60919.1 hypothetical protein [Vibrio phage ValKK3]
MNLHELIRQAASELLEDDITSNINSYTCNRIADDISSSSIYTHNEVKAVIRELAKSFLYAVLRNPVETLGFDLEESSRSELKSIVADNFYSSAFIHVISMRGKDVASECFVAARKAWLKHIVENV